MITGGEIPLDTASTAYRRSGRSVAMEILFASLVAGGAAGVVDALDLKLWMMFIGWIAYGTGGGELHKGAMAAVSLVVGMMLAAAGILAYGALHSSLGPLALPAIVFALAAIALLLPYTRFGSVPGCFLGMTAFFASNTPPGIHVLTGLAMTAGVGAIAAWAVVAGGGWLRTGPSRRNGD